MRHVKHWTAVAVLLLFGATACDDLVVPNENAPDAELALANPGDVESLIGGSWQTWWHINRSYNGAGPMLSAMSFQHIARAANFGQLYYPAIPRNPTANNPSHGDYNQFANVYTWAYRAIAAANDGLRAIGEGLVIPDAPNADPEDSNRQQRAEAFARYIQGISYGSLAIMFDRGPIVDETTDLTAEVEFAGYPELLQAALGYLDEAIAIAEAHEFYIPTTWMFTPTAVSSEELAQIASSYKARLRAAAARTPAEAEQVNWQAVLNEINAGIEEDHSWEFDGGAVRWNSALYYTLLATGPWSWMPYFIYGMADQSGAYQQWLGMGEGNWHPILPSGNNFLIQTPDQRFPQGATLEDQMANPGTRVIAPSNYQSGWASESRGTWRWSHYRDARMAGPTADVGITPDISMVEMRLLAAEAHYQLGDLDQAATLINVTRTEAGLNATDAAGTNTSCVPKLPNNSCGDLFEMLKWEKRLEASHNNGLMISAFYFDSRRWGDLYQGSILNWPVPALVAELEGEPIVDYGGSLEWGAPVGTYGF